MRHETRLLARVAALPAGALILIVSLAPTAYAAPGKPTKAEETHTIGAYRVELWPEEVRIHQGGRVVHRLRRGMNRRLYLTATRCAQRRGARRCKRTYAVGNDVTRDGVPNLVVHRGFIGLSPGEFYVFALGSRFRLVRKFAAYDVAFRDLDADGVPEVVFGETKPFSTYGSRELPRPLPRVVYRYHRGSYRCAPGLMRRRAPSTKSLLARARRIRAMQWPKNVAPMLEDGYFAFRGSVLPLVRGEMLRLLYTGHAGLARRFLEWAWPRDKKLRRKLLETLRGAVKTSRCWRDIRRKRAFPEL